MLNNPYKMARKIVYSFSFMYKWEDEERLVK